MGWLYSKFYLRCPGSGVDGLTRMYRVVRLLAWRPASQSSHVILDSPDRPRPGPGHSPSTVVWCSGVEYSTVVGKAWDWSTDSWSDFDHPYRSSVIHHGMLILELIAHKHLSRWTQYHWLASIALKAHLLCLQDAHWSRGDGRIEKRFGHSGNAS